MKIQENLYRQIQILMPIPCIDLLVTDIQERVLMVKRKNPPAQGQWWFPGGRVYYSESREKAAIRKLREECGLVPMKIQELGTYDVILNVSKTDGISHAITTVFNVIVDNNDITLDEQSTDYAWKTITNWLDEVNNGFLLSVLNRFLTSEK